MKNVHRKVVILVSVLLLAVACDATGGDDGDEKMPSNKWDTMEWDEAKWGAVEPQSNHPAIA
jgi:hypothetical protein